MHHNLFLINPIIRNLESNHPDFFTSLGHVARYFEVPEALEIMKRGIRRASGSKD